LDLWVTVCHFAGKQKALISCCTDDYTSAGLGRAIANGRFYAVTKVLIDHPPAKK
jgi:hypothetical protein